MKLDDVKKSIDTFFESITPDELADFSINELGATELKDLGTQSLKINFKRKVVEKFEGIAVHFINDKGFDFLYLPSIQVFSQGRNLQEAKLNLDEEVDVYFKALMKLPEFTINRKLEEMGWVKVKFFNKKLKYSEPLNTKEVKAKFDLSDDTDFSPLKVAV